MDDNHQRLPEWMASNRLDRLAGSKSEQLSSSSCRQAGSKGIQEPEYNITGICMGAIRFIHILQPWMCANSR